MITEHEPWSRAQVRCIETGEVFSSAREAAKHVNVGDSAMSNHLAGRFPHVGGKTFERVTDATK